MVSDRKDDFRDRMGLTNVADFDVTQSIDESGLQVRVARWRDRRDWIHQHRTERQLGTDQLGRPSDGKFLVPVVEEVSFESPTGQKMIVSCNGRIEFIPNGNGATEVVMIHNHTLHGGNSIQRRKLRKADQNGQSALLQKQIEQCEAALRIA